MLNTHRGHRAPCNPNCGSVKTCRLSQGVAETPHSCPSDTPASPSQLPATPVRPGLTAPRRSTRPVSADGDGAKRDGRGRGAGGGKARDEERQAGRPLHPALPRSCPPPLLLTARPPSRPPCSVLCSPTHVLSSSDCPCLRSLTAPCPAPSTVVGACPPKFSARPMHHTLTWIPPALCLRRLVIPVWTTNPVSRVGKSGCGSQSRAPGWGRPRALRPRRLPGAAPPPLTGLRAPGQWGPPVSLVCIISHCPAQGLSQRRPAGWLGGR